MPKYVNAGGQPREKCMIAAFALVDNFGAKQAAVADVMQVTQGTISNWVKETRLKSENANLRNQLAHAQDYIDDLSKRLRLIEYNPSTTSKKSKKQR